MYLRSFIVCCSFFFFVHAKTQKNISYLGNLNYTEKINDIWGFVDPNGNEYALVGASTGTSIVDLSDPSLPVELFFIAGDTSIWRDVKTYQNYAYVTNEEAGGLLIIDLSNLPNTINYQNWNIGILNFEKAHNLFIDENGFAYLFGSNVANQGAIILDLNFSNKFEPPLVGFYNDRYVHDGFVRDNMMWTAEVFDGDFSVVDVSDKQNPIVLARQRTSSGFTHQCWLSDDNNYLITNDEKAAAYIDLYDVSDLNNIKRLDKYRTQPDDSLIPHNTFFLGNNYFFTSYYRAGITLVDATEKDNLVEVGNFDTSPFSADNGFEGCWGVYPYLPSGNILASDREEGLFILSPTFTRAAYLEGTIIDTLTNSPLESIRVEVMGTDFIKESTFGGNYKIGVADSGMYTLRFSAPHCQTVIVSGVEFIPTQINTLNIETNCTNITSVKEINQSINYSFTPNPFKDKLQIEFESDELLKSIHIFDLQGKQLRAVTIATNKGRIEVINNWAKGSYIVKLNFENNELEEIVIKE